MVPVRIPLVKTPRKTPRTSKLTAAQRAKLHGYRSGLEEQEATRLKAKGINPNFETIKIKYVVPAREATYTPDFPLDNGIIVETKGRFLTKDRQKHLLIQKQHPELDIRFVFGGNRKKPSDTPISKGSKTTYAMWCEKYGFTYADHTIPEDWLTES